MVGWVGAGAHWVKMYFLKILKKFFFVFGSKSVKEIGGGVGGESGMGWGGLEWVHIGSKLIYFSFLMFLAQNLLGRGGRGCEGVRGGLVLYTPVYRCTQLHSKSSL